jgi:histone-lysine N-methyltransferase SETMAR
VTLDESWFYLNVHHERIWLHPDEEIPERERHTVQPEKMMTTTVWSLSGFHLIKLLPKRFKFNASYCVTQVLDPLSVWRGNQIGKTNQKFMVHADDAHPHTANVTLDFMERNAMKRAPRPPYSPDLAPSNFCLFGHVKQLLRG